MKTVYLAALATLSSLCSSAYAEQARTVSDTRLLPGHDCKLYEGGTRQHRFPQYEVGNPNRPLCTLTQTQSR